MTATQHAKIQSLLRFIEQLEAVDVRLRDEGNWESLDNVRLALDEARDALKALRAQ